MHVNLLYPNEYLCAADLRGEDVALEISRLDSEELRVEKGENERKWIVYFAEMEYRAKRDRHAVNKRLVLNKTNAKLIAKVLGTETDDWIGKRITLYPTTCQAFGQTVDCIRVRDKEPAPKRSEPAPVNDAVADWTIAIEQAADRPALDQIVSDMAADKRLGIRDRAALGNIAAERAEAVVA